MTGGRAAGYPSANESWHHDHSHHSGGHGHGDDHGHPHGLRAAFAAVFRPHAHDSADRVDAALAASVQGMRALKISLAGLAITAAAQFAVMLASGSAALLADTIHNFADALTAIPIGIAFLASRRPANRRYTYGYGRGEDMAGLFVLLAMTASALLAAYESVDRLIHPRPLHHLWWIAAAGLIGFIGNELVGAYRIRVGRQTGSGALVADGLHARTDGLTSLAVLLGVAGVAAGWPPADPLIGLGISVAILGVLRQAAREVHGRMMDRVDDHTVTLAEQAIHQVQGVSSLDRLRMRWSGHELLAEVDLSADASLTFVQAHDIADAVRHQMLHQVRRLADATVHISPATAPPALNGTSPVIQLRRVSLKQGHCGPGRLASNLTGDLANRAVWPGQPEPSFPGPGPLSPPVSHYQRPAGPQAAVPDPEAGPFLAGHPQPSRSALPFSGHQQHRPVPPDRGLELAPDRRGWRRRRAQQDQVAAIGQRGDHLRPVPAQVGDQEQPGQIQPGVCRRPQPELGQPSRRAPGTGLGWPRGQRQAEQAPVPGTHDRTAP